MPCSFSLLVGYYNFQRATATEKRLPAGVPDLFSRKGVGQQDGAIEMNMHRPRCLPRHCQPERRKQHVGTCNTTMNITAMSLNGDPMQAQSIGYQNMVTRADQII